ncbi:hypothetical protein SARC_06564 [Sphaeroforma arctica JP610]|uniref:DUF5672 domain-containing protein n=1 Tax=Sphaeroforma arctica JP610 TaxID=667725 RepID=A0A0L0FYT1_9EUKA|nr:hypothetical protein SARC_06564 [Sphaeroforma arctica JP610]KNC81103.1 hypothetical protein SARC_06564 [Sphaeroforma arctica JP610]|eukprot:XP_014155005.1 hypothetical protein SARC_06564 [Sphaeroforma arctica JP610]
MSYISSLVYCRVHVIWFLSFIVIVLLLSQWSADLSTSEIISETSWSRINTINDGWIDAWPDIAPTGNSEAGGGGSSASDPVQEYESHPESGYKQDAQMNAISKNAMLYMEPRRIENAMYVLNNFNSLTPMSWDLVIVCSSENQDFMEQKANMLLGTRKVYFLVILPAIFSGAGYNALFLKLAFWNQIPYDTVLVFQSDSVLCANSPFRIEDFMKYKYIGCALGEAYGVGSHYDWAPHPFYGSGGLTIRNVEYHKACLKNPKLASLRVGPWAAEDLFFSHCVHEGSETDRAENVTVMQQFCTQQGFKQPSFGMHKFWDQGYRFAPSHVRKMVEHCPEIIPLRIQVITEPAWNITTEPTIFNLTAHNEAKAKRKLEEAKAKFSIVRQ